MSSSREIDGIDSRDSLFFSTNSVVGPVVEKMPPVSTPLSLYSSTPEVTLDA